MGIKNKTFLFFVVVVSEPPSIQSSNSHYKISDQSTLVKLIIGDTLKTSGGRDIEIKCPVKGHPVTKPLWKHGEKMLESSKSTEIDSQKKTLLLKDVDEWESGTYSCFAANGAGVAVSTTLLKILRKSRCVSFKVLVVFNVYVLLENRMDKVPKES